MKSLRVFGAILFSLALAGCATTYRTPGGPASISDIGDEDVAEAFAREPAAEFPANLIVVRIQAPGYYSYTLQSFGKGRYSVVTTRDIETDDDFERLEDLPQVADVGTISRVLLPSDLKSTRELRRAAAQLRGDIVLAYTIDTAFHTESDNVGPLSLISLGFVPNKMSYVTSTCSAAFIDVRTGYVYGITEATATEDRRSNTWRERTAMERARLKAERAAFDEALDEVEKLWASICAEHAGSGT